LIFDGDTIKSQDTRGNISPISADEIYEWIFENGSNPADSSTSSVPDLVLPGMKFSRFPVNPLIEITTDTHPDPMDLGVSFYLKNEEVEFAVPDFLTRDSDHVVHDMVWYPITKGSRDAIWELLNRVKYENNFIITLKQYLELISLPDARDSLRDLTGKAMDAGSIASHLEEPEKPVRLNGKLRPYQEAGFRWLSCMADHGIGCILADEMGLGKTIQVIALLCERYGRGDPSLVISPTTLLENWRRELFKFAPDLRALIHHGANRTGSPGELKKWDVVLTSYQTASNDLYILKMVNWDCVILDEAQAIKNPEAIRTIKTKKLPSKMAIAMSGTPIQNRLEDLWSITDFVLPGLLGNRRNFNSEFDDTFNAAIRLEPIVTPVLLRRTIAEVATELPEKIEVPQALIMDDQSATEYEVIRQKMLEENKGGAALAILTALRMFCTHPFLLNDEEEYLEEHSVKYQRLLEILEEIIDNGEKALIFTSYVKMIKLMEGDLAKRFSIYCNHIDGSVPIGSRQDIIDQFSAEKGSAILILNPNAAGVGLNITAANHVIHYNLEWNPAVEDQATGRVYRIGQTMPVTIHRLFYINTVEEIINDRMARKREMAEKAVRGVQGGEPDLDDLMNAIHISPVRKD